MIIAGVGEWSGEKVNRNYNENPEANERVTNASTRGREVVISNSRATWVKSGWKSAQLLITLRRYRTVVSSVQAPSDVMIGRA
jgi:hypothetical protein